MSGKKKLKVNNEVIIEQNESYAVFNCTFKIDKYFFNLVQISDSNYDLKINGFFFKDLMEYEMSGGFREAREKREQNTDLNKIQNIDINAKYSEKSKKEKIKIHQHKNENNLIDEDEY